MSDLDFLDGFERDLVDAARRRRDARRVASVVCLRERLGLRRIALTALVLALVGSATAAATFAVLRGSVIPGPATRDVPPEQLPAPGTVHLTALRAADPNPDDPPWTLRLARSSTGLLCSTVGQLVDGRFGLIGLDGRFRTYAPSIVDSCGERVSGPHASLIGARVFAARDPAQVRTVVNGVAGSELRSVTVIARGRRIAVPIGAGGTFLHALAGYPEDSALEVELRFAGDALERRDFGSGRAVVTDAAGGHAWRANLFPARYQPGVWCASFEPTRPGAGRGLSPDACGRQDADVVAAVERLEPGSGSWREQFRGRGLWGAHPAQTAVWGFAGRAVAGIDVDGGGSRRSIETRPGQAFVVVFPATVDPAALTLRVRFRDGRVVSHRGDVARIGSKGRIR